MTIRAGSLLHRAPRIAAATLALGVVSTILVACESTENGKTRTTSTKVEETPTERTKTTTTKERTVEPVR